MEATEALKLFFNLALVDTSRVDEAHSEEDLQRVFAGKFEQCISHTLNLIKEIPLSATNTLSSPLLNAIHALLHIPYSSSWDERVVAKLAEALTLAIPDLISDDDEENLDRLRERQADNTIAPLLLVLRRAAANDQTSKAYLSKTLLPSERYAFTSYCHCVWPVLTIVFNLVTGLSLWIKAPISLHGLCGWWLPPPCHIPETASAIYFTFSVTKMVSLSGCPPFNQLLSNIDLQLLL